MLEDCRKLSIQLLHCKGEQAVNLTPSRFFLSEEHLKNMNVLQMGVRKKEQTWTVTLNGIQNCSLGPKMKLACLI